MHSSADSYSALPCRPQLEADCRDLKGKLKVVLNKSAGDDELIDSLQEELEIKKKQLAMLAKQGTGPPPSPLLALYDSLAASGFGFFRLLFCLRVTLRPLSSPSHPCLLLFVHVRVSKRSDSRIHPHTSKHTRAHHIYARKRS